MDRGEVIAFRARVNDLAARFAEEINALAEESGFDVDRVTVDLIEIDAARGHRRRVRAVTVRFEI